MQCFSAPFHRMVLIQKRFACITRMSAFLKAILRHTTRTGGCSHGVRCLKRRRWNYFQLHKWTSEIFYQGDTFRDPGWDKKHNIVLVVLCEDTCSFLSTNYKDSSSDVDLFHPQFDLSFAAERSAVLLVNQTSKKFNYSTNERCLYASRMDRLQLIALCSSS